MTSAAPVFADAFGHPGLFAGGGGDDEAGGRGAKVGFPLLFLCARVSCVSSHCALEAAKQCLRASAWYAQTLEGH